MHINNHAKITVMNETMKCDNCGNPLTIRQPYCHKCFRELGKYPINEMSPNRCIYEKGIIKGFMEFDQAQPHIVAHLEQINNRLSSLITRTGRTMKK